jgi:hypothetical protein
MSVDPRLNRYFEANRQRFARKWAKKLAGKKGLGWSFEDQGGQILIRFVNGGQQVGESLVEFARHGHCMSRAVSGVTQGMSPR